MSELDLTKYPHRRFNPLLREWVLVSPHRNERPWQGQVESSPAAAIVKYDPACYMCPGNKRSTGAANPDYKNVLSSTTIFQRSFQTARMQLQMSKIFSSRKLKRNLPRALFFSAPRPDSFSNERL